MAIKTYGYNEINRRIKEQGIGTKASYDLRQLLLRVNNVPDSTFDSDLIVELDNAVNRGSTKSTSPSSKPDLIPILVMNSSLWAAILIEH